MESKSCMSCKWHWSSECHCKDTILALYQPVEADTRYIDFIEDGHWSQLVEEQVDIRKVLTGLLEELSAQDFLKKNKSLKKMDMLQAEEDLTEYIKDSLDTGIQNFFNKGTSTPNELVINNPSEFNCKNWE